jgi:hypothetical protein
MNSVCHYFARCFLAAMMICAGSLAHAHETTRSYVTLARDGKNVAAQFRIAFRDIEVAAWMDENLDGKVTWGETKQRLDAISTYVLSAFSLDAGGPCALTLDHPAVSAEGGIDYLDLQFKGVCPDAVMPLKVSSRLFREIDPDHRMFLTAKSGGATTTTLLSASDPEVMISADTGGLWRAFFSYFKSGVEHLLGGADHLVFLFVLMLPAVGSQTNARKAALGAVAALTGFTLAHALTLTAAATDLLKPPTAIINILIALSIVITAVDNIRPFIAAPRSAVAAFFGIIHGFGFASALGVLQLTGWELAVTLIGFNLGIEVAQVAAVFIALPILYLAGKGQLILRLGSLVAVGIGLYWVWQRLGL